MIEDHAIYVVVVYLSRLTTAEMDRFVEFEIDKRIVRDSQYYTREERHSCEC